MLKTPDPKKFSGLLGQNQFPVIFSSKYLMAFRNESENFDVTLDLLKYLKNISLSRVTFSFPICLIEFRNLVTKLMKALSFIADCLMSYKLFSWKNFIFLPFDPENFQKVTGNTNIFFLGLRPNKNFRTC